MHGTFTDRNENQHAIDSHGCVVIWDDVRPGYYRVPVETARAWDSEERDIVGPDWPAIPVPQPSGTTGGFFDRDGRYHACDDYSHVVIWDNAAGRYLRVSATDALERDAAGADLAGPGWPRVPGHDQVPLAGRHDGGDPRRRR